MNIVLLSRDEKDYIKHKVIRDQILAEKPNINVTLLCGAKVEDEYSEWIYEGYDQFLDSHKNESNKEVTLKLSKFGSQVSPSLYKADRRFVYEYCSEKDLAIEQVFLCEHAINFFEVNNIDAVFMTGGGNLVRNVFYSVAKSSSIKAYRILNASYLNPNREGVRYWFSENNFCLLSGDGFDYPAKQLAEHTSSLMESIEVASYKLDNTAKTKRSTRASLQLKDFCGDLAKNLVKKALKRPDGNRESRIRSAINYHLNKLNSAKADFSSEINIIYALNVPEDAQITLRAPHFRDQLSICQQICNVLPFGARLVLKEHPGHLGMLPYRELSNFLKRNKNASFIDGDESMQEWLGKADVLIVMNSTSALEGFLQGTPVITLGPSYYRCSGLDQPVKSFVELSEALAEAINNSKRNKNSNKQELKSILESLISETVPFPNEIIGEEKYLDVISKGIIRKCEAY